MWEILATIGWPVLKFFYERWKGKKLSDEEFLATVVSHRNQRNGAGQTVLDWQDSMAKLEEEFKKQQAEQEDKES